MKTIWNPNAAANWSLIFTPAFGSYIHYKNWKELGDDNKAKTSLIWTIVAIIMTIVTVFVPAELGGNQVLFIFLVIWYFANGRAQSKYIKQNNIEYSKKGWGLPIVFGVLYLVLFIGIATALEVAGIIQM